MFASFVSGKRLPPKMYKEPLQHNSNKITQPKIDKRPEQIYLQRRQQIHDMVNRCMKKHSM